MEFGEIVVSGDELHDSDADDALDAIWAVNEITNIAIITALNERVFRHLDVALALDKEKNLTNAEYTRMAQNLATLEARRYVKKRATRGTSNVSITSSRSRASAGQPRSDKQEGKRPSFGSTPSRQASPEIGSIPSDDGNTTSRVIPSVPTESTSQESGHRSTVMRPPPSNWGERVCLQRARNGALSTIGVTSIPDQEVIFQDSCPYDMRARSPQDGEQDVPTAGPAVKQDSQSLSAPSITRPTLTQTKRARFTGHTAVSPMSQQHYPGRLNPDNDPLTGPRTMVSLDNGSNQGSGHIIAPTKRTRPGREPPPHLDTERPSQREHRARVPTHDSGDPEDDGRWHRNVNRTSPPRQSSGHRGWERERQLRGYSMPAVKPPPTISIGKQEVDQHYRDSMLSRLMNTITEALGQPLRFPEGYKPPFKDDKFARYSGSPKFSELEQWLARLAYRYALLKFGGESYDMDRVRILSLTEYLEGDALNWFTTHVLSAKRTTMDWSFCDVITGLYD